MKFVCSARRDIGQSNVHTVAGDSDGADQPTDALPVQRQAGPSRLPHTTGNLNTLSCDAFKQVGYFLVTDQ